VNPSQPCASVPFVLTRGDAIGLRAVSVTFQLETAKLQLCNPGPPSASITLGTWASAFPNRTIQATSLGGGRYTVDIVILGANCGETGGGTLFTVNVAAVGPTGTGTLSVVSQIARDCANSPVAISAGPAATVPISGSAIVLAPATLPDAFTGAAYSETVTASGGSGPFTFTVSAGSLPAGLTLSPAGLISGTPTQAGTFPFTLRASEPGGCFGSRAYSVTITCPVVTIQPAYLPDGAAGEEYSATLLATAGTPPYVFTVTAGSLPAGLTLSGAGELTGTPLAPGSTAFTVTVTGAAGCTGQRDYTLDVFASPPLSSVAPQTAGLAVSSAHPCVSVPFVYDRGESTPVRALSVSLQIDPTKLALCSTPDSSVHLAPLFGSLAERTPRGDRRGERGLHGGHHAAGCTLRGHGGRRGVHDRPRVGRPRRNGLGGRDARALRATVTTSRWACWRVLRPACASRTRTSRSHHPSCRTRSWACLTPRRSPRRRGVAPFTFALSAGALPPGFSLAPDGNLTGLPSATGSFAFTVSVSDEGGVPGHRAYSLSVACAVIAITPSSLPDAQEGVAYAQTLVRHRRGGAAHVRRGLGFAAGRDLALVRGRTLRHADGRGRERVHRACHRRRRMLGEEVYTLPVFRGSGRLASAGRDRGALLVRRASVRDRAVRLPEGRFRAGDRCACPVPARFALRAVHAGNPEQSILPGSWLAGFPNATFHVSSHGGGSYSVDQVLLGSPCGPDTGGVLFTVNLAATGGDGAGDITVADAHIRDCSNAPLPGQPGPPAQLVISHVPPGAITDLAVSQVLAGNGPGPLVRLLLEWTPPVEGQVAIYRAPFGTYPEFDDAGGVTPDPTAAPGAPWTLLSADASSPLLHVPPSRGVWHFVAIVTDSCGNASLASNLTPGVVNYHLGDVSNGVVRGVGDGRVATEDVSLLGRALRNQRRRTESPTASAYLGRRPDRERAVVGPARDGQTSFGFEDTDAVLDELSATCPRTQDAGTPATPGQGQAKGSPSSWSSRRS
jgi:hypothetical protein